MEINDITIETFKDKAKETDFGVIGNSILYDACKRYPNHSDKSEIIAKTWLIGRSYAVSLERMRSENRKNKKEISDDFYINVAEKFIRINFDKFLSELRSVTDNAITEQNIPIILRTHKEITSFIEKNITNDNRRSFVSKYLHFHFKNLFYLYDSRVAQRVMQIRILKSNFGYDKNNYKKILDSSDYDKLYADFFVKCFFLQDSLKKVGLSLTLRELDSCLIKIANDIERGRNENRNISSVNK